MEKFRELGIIESIIKVIESESFEAPTEIQEKAIPLILKGKDVIAGSATGSGKTLAFGAGIIHSCEKGRGLQALVLTPTRELAEQIMIALNKFSKYKPLDIIAIYGGVSINPQIDQLRRADVVIGTPGRILDHIGRETIDLRKVNILVLDEADRMFDMGFKDDVEKIIWECNSKRQTLLFSATLNREVSAIADKHMKDPIEIMAESYVDPSKLKQVYYDVADNKKFSLLVHFLKNERGGLAMVFCNTKRNTDFLAKNLTKHGIDTLAIHGDLSQARRSQAMGRFNNNKAGVLVCTDVASRGLDIKGVSHIYNYDIPKDSKEYIHRIGRTARAGKEGIAINLLSSRDYENFGRVQQDRSLNIDKEELPNFEFAPVLWKERRFERGPSQGYGRGGHERQGQGHGRPGQSQGRGRFPPRSDRGERRFSR